MQDIIAALVSVFLLGPLQAEMADALAAARAPQAVAAPVAECARTAAPILAARAAEDPWWAARSALWLWLGWSRPEALLLEAAPGCAAAVEAARPFLRPSGA